MRTASSSSDRSFTFTLTSDLARTVIAWPLWRTFPLGQGSGLFPRTLQGRITPRAQRAQRTALTRTWILKACVCGSSWRTWRASREARDVSRQERKGRQGRHRGEWRSSNPVPASPLGDLGALCVMNGPSHSKNPVCPMPATGRQALLPAPTNAGRQGRHRGEWRSSNPVPASPLGDLGALCVMNVPSHSKNARARLPHREPRCMLSA
jgi:hypothetical protein